MSSVSCPAPCHSGAAQPLPSLHVSAVPQCRCSHHNHTRNSLLPEKLLTFRLHAHHRLKQRPLLNVPLNVTNVRDVLHPLTRRAASAAFHKSPAVCLAVMKFFLGQDAEQQDDGDAHGDEEGAAAAAAAVAVPSKQEFYKANKQVGRWLSTAVSLGQKGTQWQALHTCNTTAVVCPLKHFFACVSPA